MTASRSSPPVTITIGGKLVTQQKVITKRENKRILAFADPRYMRLVRTRTLKPLPDIDITNSASAFEDFEKAFNVAIS